jgi:TrmH family RNA methyltransferase
MLIASATNPKIKYLLKLRKKSFRNSEGVFLIEGARELERAIASEFELRSIFFCREYTEKREDTMRLLDGLDPRLCLQVSADVYSKIAVREDAEGFVAVASQKTHDFDSFAAENKEVLSLLVLDNVEKPGNLGAVLRTADGAGIKAVITLGPSVDPYNPAVIRASVGSVFSVPVFALSYQDFADFKQRFDIEVLALSPEASTLYWGHSFKKSSAFVFGNEAHGLSSQARSLVDSTLAMPMEGLADSLNLSVSVGIMAYEYLRQTKS